MLVFEDGLPSKWSTALTHAYIYLHVCIVLFTIWIAGRDCIRIRILRISLRSVRSRMGFQTDEVVARQQYAYCWEIRVYCDQIVPHMYEIETTPFWLFFFNYELI